MSLECGAKGEEASLQRTAAKAGSHCLKLARVQGLQELWADPKIQEHHSTTGNFITQFLTPSLGTRSPSVPPQLKPLTKPLIHTPAIEDEYSGPKLEDGKVTISFMKDLMQWYKDQKKLHRKCAYQVTHTPVPHTPGTGEWACHCQPS